MESSEGGGEESENSLFEGMILFTPSPPAEPPSPAPPPDTAPPPPETTAPPETAAKPSNSGPLDEDLFCDLTLQIPEPILAVSAPPPPQFSRQISRKKKRAVRIGYARDAADPLSQKPSPSLQFPIGEETSSKADDHLEPVPRPQSPDDRSIAGEEDSKSRPDPTQPEPNSQQQSPNDRSLNVEDENSRPDPTHTESHELPDQPDIGEETVERISPEEDTVGSMVEKLDCVRARIAKKLEKIREAAVAASSERKELGRRRRRAAEDVSVSLSRYKELEKELEDACETEDFERAESVSQSLAAADKDKESLLVALREAEMGCDSADSRMHELLELHIVAEEEGVTLLEQFAKDADDYADMVLKNVEEISSKESEEWQSSMESLEIKKLEMDVESHLISEARLGLEHAIDHLVEDERKEKELLKIKQDTLTKELDDLLVLVRLKEAEIAENDLKIQKVEKRIADVFSEFHGSQSNIDMKNDSLQMTLSKIESEGEALLIGKKKVDEFISLEEQKGSKIRELVSASLDEARTFQDMVRQRKSLASSIVKSREDKLRLAKIEEKVFDEIQILRQQISVARATLQELSSTRADIQQEIASFKQRIGFIDKRGPELEAEKKVAASARNFKEAGRIAVEAKSLNFEKEGLHSKKEDAVLHLNKLERQIEETLEKIQESETLILSKEKEAAMASSKRLMLVAAAARAGRRAALEMDDTEEGNALLNEAEATESKARELQEAYDLELEEHENFTSEHFVSVAMITNLAKQHLPKITTCFNLASPSRSQV